jgi:hypothetical protein
MDMRMVRGRHLGWYIGRHRGWRHSRHRMHYSPKRPCQLALEHVPLCEVVGMTAVSATVGLQSVNLAASCL